MTSYPRFKRFRRILKENMWGEDVRELQELLREQGFLVSNGDGQYGPITADAVKDFQRTHWLRVDGIAGEKTIGLLSNKRLPTLRKLYMVEEGEDIFRIAEIHGTTAKAIMGANGLKRPKGIYPGQELIIQQREIYLDMNKVQFIERKGLGLLLPGSKLTSEGEIPHDPLAEETPSAIYSILEIEEEELKGSMAKAGWRQKIGEKLSRRVTSQGLAGLGLKIEGTSSGFRQNITRFIRELSKAMDMRGKELILYLPPLYDLDPREVRYWREVSGQVDKVILPVYRKDQAEPGPISPYDEVKTTVKQALTVVPSYKIIMALATWGLDWRKKRDEMTVAPISFNEIYGLIKDMGCRVSCDPISRTPFIKYREGRVFHDIWFENGWSLGYKLNLVNKFNLRGVALDQYNGPQPDFWDEVDARFKIKPLP
jgi:LysM repeat protein